MLPSAEVAGIMSALGFERIVDVPASPADSRGRIRYDLRVTTCERAEEWYLRSYGTEFDIMLTTWPRAGITRCYSLGWGAAGSEQQVGLLLAQAVGPPSELAQLGQRLTCQLGDHVPQFTSTIGHFSTHQCLRVAALLHSSGPCLRSGGANA
jgi:hypothetical protein